MCSPQIGYGWRYVSGGVERSCDDRFDVVEHEDGFSVYDNERSDSFAHVYKSDRSAKRAANAVRLGFQPRYALEGSTRAAV